MRMGMIWLFGIFMAPMIPNPSGVYAAEWTPINIPFVNNGFEQIAHRDNVTVYQHQNSDIIRVGAETNFPISADNIVKALLDYEHQVGKITRLSESKILASGPHWLIVYQRLNLPIISDRDFTLYVTWGKNQDLDWITYHAISQKGPPPRPGIVRVTHHQGSWQLKPIAEGKATLIRFQMSMDLAGWIPKWLARSHTGEELPELFKSLRKML